MADEKQLTVAELLARSGKNSSAGEQSRPRRRRRSLEDGGVSVAELTGSIPKVDTKPVEARHSNIPLDESTAAPGGTAVQDAPPTQDPVTAPPAVEQRPADKAAAPEPSDAEVAEKPRAGGRKVAAEAPNQSAADKFAAAKTAATAATETSAAAPGTAEDTTRVSPSHDDTQVISAIESAAPERRETAAGPVKTGTTAAAQAAAAAVPAGLATGFAHTSEATGEIPVVEDRFEADVEEQVEDWDDENGAVSVWTVIGLAAAGIILGVLVFLGFDYLWGNFNRLVVGVAALVVTAVMILGTRVLRTANDGFSMALAGTVGLLMTFGPALIMYLT